MLPFADNVPLVVVVASGAPAPTTRVAASVAPSSGTGELAAALSSPVSSAAPHERSWRRASALRQHRAQSSSSRAQWTRCWAAR